MKNNFGKTSKLQITASCNQGKTYLDEVYFTAPLKVMNPIYPRPDYLQIILMSASAGMMSGDKQDINIVINPGCHLEFTAQAYEKIHKMEEGFASRKSLLTIRKNSFFRYNPLPVIPFSGSAFQSHNTIMLEDETSQFMMCDIISCGRYACNEQFEYQYFKSLTQIFCNNSLIYRDNTNYQPLLFPMQDIGFYERYHVLANITLIHFKNQECLSDTIYDYLSSVKHIDFGITKLENHGILIKVLAQNSQILEAINNSIFSLVNPLQFP